MRKLLDKQKKHFQKGGKLEKFYPLFEAFDTFLYSPDTVTKGLTHVRDVIDLKRTMSIVVLAAIPCILMGMYNTGLQIHQVLQSSSNLTPVGWRVDLLSLLGVSLDPSSIVANFLHGALYFFPIYIVCNVAGGICEVLFSIIRKHEINEGFFVTGTLIPLILPPTIPLWQVAVGTAFGVVVGKEIFGGTGRNFLNPALTARAFLFFAYPAEISGDSVWLAVDGFSGATPLSTVAVGGAKALAMTWNDAFIGFVPGSFGETSTLACLIGAAILIFSGVGSWRIMLSVLLGTVVLSLLFNFIGSDTNLLFSLTPEWHVVLGGFAFGTVYMATDPVSAAQTIKGQYIYGLLIGLMVVLIRVINPAFPEGMMLAILFGNILAPAIDYFVVKGKIKQRKQLVEEATTL